MLTVMFHVHLPQNARKWELLDSDRYDCLRYKQQMSSKTRTKIILQIVFFTIATFGLYLVKLNCTQSGINDLKNLKKRRIIHYLSTVHLKEDISFKRTINNSYEIGSTIEKEHKTNLRMAKQAIMEKKALQKIKEEKNDKVKDLSSLIQQIMQKVKDLSRVSEELKKLGEIQKNVVLEDLFNKNHKLALKLEEFFFLKKEDQNAYNFIQLINPFLNEKDLDQLLNRTIAISKDTFVENTFYKQAFDNFIQVYDKLEDPASFLISLFEGSEKRPLLEYAISLFCLKGCFSTLFIPLYKNNKDLFLTCLEKMKQPYEIDTKNKLLVEDSFKRWKQVHKKLNKNLSLECRGDTLNVIYRLKDHHKEALSQAGYSDSLNKTLQSNCIDVFFIKYYLEHQNSVLEKLEDLFSDDQFTSLALIECEKKIAHAKRLKKTALKELQYEDTIQSLEHIKIFIENPAIYDAIPTLVASVALIRANSQVPYDKEYFDFLSELLFSEFYIQAKIPKLDINYYQAFHRYFDRLKDFSEITKSILKI